MGIASYWVGGIMAKKKPVKKRKGKTFSKKDWSEIFLRASSVMLMSMITQALKNNVPLTFGGQPIKEANFLLPPTVVTTTYHPKKRTRNPSYANKNRTNRKRP